MKAKSRHLGTGRRPSSNPFARGHLLIEMVLLTAMATLIGAMGMRAVAAQHKAHQDRQMAIEAIQAAEASCWVLLEETSRERIWTRQY